MKSDLLNLFLTFYSDYMHQDVNKIVVLHLTFTKSLAQILSRDISFYNILATRKGYFDNTTLTITLAINPTLTPTLIPTLTLTQAVKNEIFV